MQAVCITRALLSALFWLLETRFCRQSQNTNRRSRICVLCWYARTITEGHEQRTAVLSSHQESKCFCRVPSRCAQTSLPCSFQNNFPRVGSQPSAALTYRGGHTCWLEAFFWSCKRFLGPLLAGSCMKLCRFSHQNSCPYIFHPKHLPFDSKSGDNWKSSFIRVWLF